MSIAVDTKDCTALSDAELVEMADLCAEHTLAYEVGTLSKQAEAWVLVTQAREGDELRGFAFCTLERIGGTPCVLIGLASVAPLRAARRRRSRHHPRPVAPGRAGLPRRGRPRRGPVRRPRRLRRLRARCRHRARGPTHKANGEERAWGGRLAKRYGIDAAAYDKRAFLARGDGSGPAEVFDHEHALARRGAGRASWPCSPRSTPTRATALIAFGWAMEEDLRALN